MIHYITPYTWNLFRLGLLPILYYDTLSSLLVNNGRIVILCHSKTKMRRLHFFFATFVLLSLFSRLVVADLISNPLLPQGCTTFPEPTKESRNGSLLSAGGTGTLNSFTTLELWTDVKECCTYPDGSTLYACSKYNQFWTQELDAPNGNRIGTPNLRYRSMNSRLLRLDFPLETVSVLRHIHAFMEHTRDIVFSIGNTLNQIYDCSLTSGACDGSSVGATFIPQFTEPTCVEDDDDDGNLPHDVDDDFDDRRCGTYVVKNKTSTDPYFLKSHIFRSFPRIERSPNTTLQAINLALENITGITSRSALEARMLTLEQLTGGKPAVLPIVEYKRTSDMVQIRYEDIVRFYNAVIDYLQFPFADRSLSCLEQFYFGAPNPIGTDQFYGIKTSLNAIARLAAAIDDDDSQDDIFDTSNPLMQVARCDAYSRPNLRDRVLGNGTNKEWGPIDVESRRVCYPYEDDPYCNISTGGSHRSDGPTRCIAQTHRALIAIIESTSNNVQRVAGTMHMRTAFLTEFLRIARERNSSLYRFPSVSAADTCFQVPFAAASRPFVYPG